MNGNDHEVQCGHTLTLTHINADITLSLSHSQFKIIVDPKMKMYSLLLHTQVFFIVYDKMIDFSFMQKKIRIWRYFVFALV